MNTDSLVGNQCCGVENQVGSATLLADKIVLVGRMQRWHGLATVKAAGLNAGWV